MNFRFYSSWEQLPDSADLLFSYCSNESMFCTREWFTTLHETVLAKDPSLLLACVIDNDEVVALLPLLGDNKKLKSLSHRYTALFSPLVYDKNRDEILSCFAQGLLQSSVTSLELNPVDDDGVMLALKQAMESAGYEYQQHFFFYNWIYRTQGRSFAEYMSDRPTRLRNTIKRKQRKLEREHSSEIRLFRGKDVQQGLADYHSAYTASWKANEQFVELLDTLAINFSTPDWTRLAILYIDGKASAAQLWFVVDKKASIFRLAYSEDWRHYSPGSILTAYLMEYVIDKDNVEEIDFLTGNETYKQDWMSVRRQRYRSLFINRSIKPDKPTLTSRLQRQLRSLFRSS